MEMLNQPFEAAYERMLHNALKTSGEERKRRLLKKHSHLEKLFLFNVWWPAMGNLDNLHPEYEIRDFKEGTRFLDYTYIPNSIFSLAIELDGFGPHWRDLSRWQFADNLMRQNHLLIDGWKLLRFAYDDVNEKPRICQQTLLMAMSKWGQGKEALVLNVYERAIIQFSLKQSVDLTPKRVSEGLGINIKTAIRNLQSLSKKGFLTPIQSLRGRTMKYVASSQVLSDYSV
ncbi:DNA-binding response regulator [Cohnella faecalis]|uniref:DNA-binding response regulator n=1 Tax=Cohnella faecalis TaxID=2315694 RepID=A0A398CK40_9BACL|nr:DNA-binding response regulator [Cohnella faecalis]RIE02512.1 DNA-binding response regulator [Cohnella faecalis]